jgi:hypothetical protein
LATGIDYHHQSTLPSPPATSPLSGIPAGAAIQGKRPSRRRVRTSGLGIWRTSLHGPVSGRPRGRGSGR